MRKIVLDTNCLLMSLPKISPSNDAHFKNLNEIDFPKIFVLKIKEFIDLLLKEKNNPNS